MLARDTFKVSALRGRSSYYGNTDSGMYLGHRGPVDDDKRFFRVCGLDEWADGCSPMANAVMQVNLPRLRK